MNGQDWPEIVTERRETIASRTAEGAECTLIALRRRDGQLGLYLHGRIRCSVMLPPPCTPSWSRPWPGWPGSGRARARPVRHRQHPPGT